MQGQGPLVIRVERKQVGGTVASAQDDGRFVTVTLDGGGDVRLRIGADTDIEGVSDRSLLKSEMRISALYQIPEDVNPALGYDAQQLTVAK